MEESLAQTTHPNSPSRNTKMRAWCFTWNNYTEENIEYLIKTFEKEQYLFGKEKGSQNTPHLQGVVRFKNQRTFKSVRKIFMNNHIEPCQNWQASLNYCSKDGETYTNIKSKMKKKTKKERILEIVYNNVVWKKWQQDIIDIINGEVDDRLIYWFWEEKGNVGKSYLCKYISLKYDVIIATGKQSDIYNQLLIWDKEHPDDIQIPPVIIDNPRNEFGNINFSAIEELKNGFLYSGKYEGGRIHGLQPHVIIFANSPPQKNKLSEDKLKIVKIEE